MIPDSFKQDLLNRLDIVEVVSRHLQLRKGGANYLGLCPFHGEKTPSFTVSPAKQFYHCFGCGAHGNAIGFVMAYSGLGYVEAVKELAASVGLPMPEWQPRTPQEAARKERETDLGAVLETAMDFYRAELKKSPRAIAYLKGRGLTGEIAARFRIGYAPDDWQGLRGAFPDYEHASLVDAGLVVVNEGKRYDRFRDRVMFPILGARGGVIGFGGRVLGQGEPKYLNSPETPLFEKGRELYGLVQAREAIRAAGRAVVVEGYMDVVALAQHGVGHAVATLGTATTPVHVSKLLRLADELVFCFDGDEAGRKAAWRALEVSLPLATDAKPMRFLFLPENEDPDSYVRKNGRERFEHVIGQAQTLSQFLIGELRAQFDLTTPEGRAGFIVASKVHLAKLGAAALRMQLVKEFASIARVSDADIERLIQPSAGPIYRKPSPPRDGPPLTVSSEQLLLRHLLIRPELSRNLQAELLDSSRPETGVLRVIAGLPLSGEASGGLLLDYFQGTDFERLVWGAQAASLELRDTQETVLQDFEQTQLSLRIQRKNEQIEALIGRVATDPALNAELNQRVKELHQLKARRS